MARIRTIKPEFWQDEDIAMLEPETKLLAIGLLNMADDEGFFKSHPALVKAAIFPFTEHSLNIHGMLKQLENIGYLVLFDGSDGKQYGEIVNFTKHQKVSRPSPSKIKAFKVFTESSLNAHGELSDGKEQGTGNREQGMECLAGDESPAPAQPAKQQNSSKAKPESSEQVLFYMTNYINNNSANKPNLARKNAMQESDRFFNHYSANGWVVGKAKSKMKDWQAAARNWLLNDFGNSRQVSNGVTMSDLGGDW